MEPPYPGYGDYGSEEGEEHRPSLFHHRPPPPPPSGEDDFGERRRFDERREDDDGGFPRRPGRFEEERFGREDDEDGYGRRRGDYERERFGRGEGREEGYRPEGRPHFPQVGFHRPQREDAPVPCDDSEYPQYGAPSHSLTHSGSHHGQSPSDVYGVTADPLEPSHPFTHSGSYHGKSPSDVYAVTADPLPPKEELPPAEDASLSGQMGSLSLDLPQGRIVRIFCKENSAFNLAVDHNSLEMQESNTEDELQQWVKDSSHGMRVKDSYGHPAFSLVNKKTKKVLKHTNEKGQQVLLVDYQPDLKDDDILWTESQDFGEGFKTLRSASDPLLNLTVFEGHKRIRNGSALMLDTWHKGDHQLWKIFPL